MARRAEDLQGSTGSRHRGQWRRAADVDHRCPHLEEGVGVDHHRHVLGDVEGGAVGEWIALRSLADEVGELVVCGGSIAAVADNPDD